MKKIFIFYQEKRNAFLNDRSRSKRMIFSHITWIPEHFEIFRYRCIIIIITLSLVLRANAGYFKGIVEL